MSCYPSEVAHLTVMLIAPVLWYAIMLFTHRFTMCSHAIPQYSLAVSKYAVMLSISSCTLWKLCYSFAVSKYAVMLSTSSFLPCSHDIHVIWVQAPVLPWGTCCWILCITQRHAHHKIVLLTKEVSPIKCLLAPFSWEHVAYSISRDTRFLSYVCMLIWISSYSF